MQWSDYIACFFAGLFLANTVPHFIHGISGNKFPTPFAKPPGKGLSSPVVNVLWVLINLIIGSLLFNIGKISWENIHSVEVFFLGVTAISIMLSISFAKKMKE